MPKAMLIQPTQKHLDRFWKKVDRSHGENACWVWQGTKNQWGYGLFGYQYGQAFAHRLMWFLHHGEIPPKMEICHHCDNPSCVNPAHLYAGTHAENMMDQKVRGRISCKVGERNPNVKLKAEDVLEIRRLYADGTLNQSQLAERYGVNKVQICHIVNRKRWKNI